MKKISLSILIIILVISLVSPVLANQTIIEDNPVGEELELTVWSEKMVNNYGVVKSNKGHIENNYGIVNSVEGSIYNNYGTVNSIDEKGTVVINEGVITENNYYVNVNNASGIIKNNNYRVQVNQCGTIENNNSEVWSNFGTINSNNVNGYIDDNYGIIENNKGTILRNKYSTDNIITSSVNNIENGIVLENHAKVTGGTIEKNYSKDVRNVIINNNYSSEVGENVNIIKNFTEPIDNATIENQYYKLTINGNINLVCAIDSNNNLEDNIYTDQEGQTWIRAEDAMFTVTAQRGYKIVGIPTVTVGGTTIVNKEDARNISFSNISGEITIEVETEEVETFKVVFNANGGIFKNETETLTYEEWIPEDYETLEEPIRNGYKFLGYFTEKEGGTSFANYYNEAGVDKDMTLYAQWQENSSSAGGEAEPEESDKNSENAVTDNTNIVENNNSTVIGKNPQTGDNIEKFVIILGNAIMGIIITTKMKKHIKK